MKAAYLTGIRKLNVGEMPDPTLSATRNVRVQVGAIGICGSDVHGYATGGIGLNRIAYPFIIGHEAAGIVQEVGPGVSRVSPGDRVAIEPAISCGACDQCLAGRANTCRHIIFMSTSGQSDGLLCEQVTVPEANCIPIPDGMALETAALAEPLSISVYSVQKSVPITPETRIGILGAGPIGLGILAVCKAYGAERTYITDRLDYRIDAARGLGATWGGNPDQGDIVSAIEELEPLQMDVVFECCGKQEAIDQAMQLLKPGGKLMLVGIPEESQISIGIDTARRHEITIYNVRRQCGCVEEAIELLDNGSIDPKSFITHRLPLECAPEAFRMVDNYANGVIKAIVTTQGERI